MVDAKSLRTMAAPRQKEIKDSATVVAMTTFAEEGKLDDPSSG
jgi:hypothetical protein